MTIKKVIVTILSSILAIIFASCNLTLPSSDKQSSEDSKQDQKVYLFQASEGTAQSFFNNPQSGSYIYGEYVPQDDLPGIFSADELKGAVKVSYHSINHKNFDKLYLKLDYTVSELEALKSTYKSAKFNIYFEVPSQVDLIYQWGGKHIISYVETYNSGWSSNQVHKNTWSNYEIPLDNLILSMQTEETSADEQTAYVFAGDCVGDNKHIEMTMNVYISDFELVKKLGS